MDCLYNINWEVHTGPVCLQGEWGQWNCQVKGDAHWNGEVPQQAAWQKLLLISTPLRCFLPSPTAGVLTVAHGSSPLSREGLIPWPACFMISKAEHLFLDSVNICTSLGIVCFSPLPFYVGPSRFFLLLMRTLWCRDPGFLCELDRLPPSPWPSLLCICLC